MREDKSAFPAGMDSGMTLRDYFAAKAMQGILSNSDHLNIILEATTETSVSQAIAKDAYYTADCMIAERNKEKEIE